MRTPHLPNRLGAASPPLLPRASRLLASFKSRHMYRRARRAARVCVDGLMRETSCSPPIRVRQHVCVSRLRAPLSPNPPLSASATTQQEDLKRRHSSSPRRRSADTAVAFRLPCSRTLISVSRKSSGGRQSGLCLFWRLRANLSCHGSARPWRFLSFQSSTGIKLRLKVVCTT